VVTVRMSLDRCAVHDGQKPKSIIERIILESQEFLSPYRGARHRFESFYTQLVKVQGNPLGCMHSISTENPHHMGHSPHDLLAKRYHHG
jgi:hypothetical protein